MTGYDLDTLSDDRAAVIEQRGLRNAVIVAHSMGTVEAVNYFARHGSGQISRLVLAAPTTPYLMKTEDPLMRYLGPPSTSRPGRSARDYPKWIADNKGPFFTPETRA
jgi:non-heme chloroperoxidase